MITSLKQKKIKFNPRIKLNHNTFNPSRSIKHFYVVHWSGPEDDSIFVRTHSYNKLKKVIFISWNDKFYCTLMIMIWTQKILHNHETILAHFCFDWKQKWNNQCQFFSFLKYCNHAFICLWHVNYLITITKLLDNYLILLQNY